jgi:hypothetical protein
LPRSRSDALWEALRRPSRHRQQPHLDGEEPTSTRWQSPWLPRILANEGMVQPGHGIPAVGDGEGYCPRRQEDRRRNRRKVSGITRPRMRIKAGMEIHVRAICGATRRTVRFHQRPRAGSMLPRGPATPMQHHGRGCAAERQLPAMHTSASEVGHKQPPALQKKIGKTSTSRPDTQPRLR